MRQSFSRGTILPLEYLPLIARAILHAPFPDMSHLEGVAIAALSTIAGVLAKSTGLLLSCYQSAEGCTLWHAVLLFSLEEQVIGALRIQRIRWTSDRVAHIARHGLSPSDVEEAVFDDPNGFSQRLKRAGRNPEQRICRYLGTNEEGRYIAFIFIYEGGRTAYPVTARGMTDSERRRYHAQAGR